MSNQNIENSASIATQINLNANTINITNTTNPATPDFLLRIETEKGDSIRWRGNFQPKNLTDIWSTDGTSTRIEFHADPLQFESLSRSILRLAIHSNNLTLAVANASSWNHAASDCVRKYLGADKETWEPCLTQSMSGWKLDNLLPTTLPSSATEDVVYQASDLARRIDTRLDDWIVQQLHAHITQALTNNVTALTNYPIETHLASLMWTRWKHWKGLLDNNIDLRSHFLATMLTTAHNEAELRVSARAGKRTLTNCILRPALFALGIAVAAEPGCIPAKEHASANLVLESRDTHLVGLQLIESKWLRLAWQDIYWKASCILLPHIPVEPRALERMQKRYSDGPASGLSMHRGDLAAPSVLTGYFFEECCGMGITALRENVRQTFRHLDEERTELIRQLSPR